MSEKNPISRSPKTEIMDDEREIEEAELGAMSTRELKHELARSLSLAASGLRRAALCIKVMKERGETAPNISGYMLVSLGLIAENKLLPEAVCRFSGRRQLLKAMSTIPLVEQQKLASKPTVQVVSSDGDLVETVDLSCLTHKQIDAVFRDGHVNSAQQQKARIVRSQGARGGAEAAIQQPKYLCITLTPEQHRKVQDLASEEGVTVQDILRAALSNYGAL